MDNGGTLGLDADADAGTGILSSVMSDEGDVRGTVNLDDSPLHAFFFDTCNDFTQDLVVRQVDHGLVLLISKSGSQTDNDFVSSNTLLGVATLGQGQLAGQSDGSSSCGSGFHVHLFHNFFDNTAKNINIKRHVCHPS